MPKLPEDTFVKVNKKLSVIIPVYNAAGDLRRTLTSLSRQALGDYELIVVDDASSDRIGDLIAAWSTAIKYIRHEYNRGPGAARNTGLRAASGQYIQFLDSGDMILADKLQEQIRYLDEHKNTGVAFSDYQIIHQADNYIEKAVLKKGKESMLEYLLKGRLLHLGAMLFKKGALSAEGFDETLPQCEDWELWIRLALRSDNFAYLPGLKAYYVKSRTLSLTQDTSLWVSGLEQMVGKLKNNPLFLSRAGRLRAGFFSEVYFLAAWRLQFKRSYSAALKYYQQSFKQSKSRWFRNLINLSLRYLHFLLESNFADKNRMKKFDHV